MGKQKRVSESVVSGVHAEALKRKLDHDGRVRKWQGIRVAEKAVGLFLRRYPHEYIIHRMDQLWFKSMIFGFRANAKTGE